MINQILICAWVLFIIGFSVAIYYISRPKNNSTFTPQPTVQPYNISNINPIYEINQGIGLKPNSFQFGFVNGLPVIQFCDNNMNYNLINFFISGTDNISPSITTIPPKNQTSFIAPQMINKNINLNYGLSNNSFEVGIYNDFPSINFIDYNYTSKQLEFTLTPNTLSPSGYFFNYYISNFTPTNTSFIPDFNKTNYKILSNIVPANSSYVFEIAQNTLPVGYYTFTLINGSLEGAPNPNNLPCLLWRNNTGYNIIFFWTDNDFMGYLPPYFFKLI